MNEAEAEAGLSPDTGYALVTSDSPRLDTPVVAVVTRVLQHRLDDVERLAGVRVHLGDPANRDTPHTPNKGRKDTRLRDRHYRQHV